MLSTDDANFRHDDRSWRMVLKNLSLTEVRAKPKPFYSAIGRPSADRLAKARSLRPQVPRKALPALLPTVVVERHRARMAATGHDPFDARNTCPAAAHVRLAWAVWRGRY